MESIKRINALAVIAMIIAIGQPLTGQTGFNYISPGLQIGDTFGSGRFVAAQVTVAAFGGHYKGYPGATVGMRWQKNRRTLYLDAQKTLIASGLFFGFFPVGGGIGVAGIFTKSDIGTYRLSNMGLRLKGYVGPIGLGTLDVLVTKRSAAKMSAGWMVSYPLFLNSGI